MCATFTLFSLFSACRCHTYVHQLVTTLTLSATFDVVADWCILHLYCNLTQTCLLFSDPDMLQWICSMLQLSVCLFCVNSGFGGSMLRLQFKLVAFTLLSSVAQRNKGLGGRELDTREQYCR